MASGLSGVGDVIAHGVGVGLHFVEAELDDVADADDTSQAKETRYPFLMSGIATGIAKSLKKTDLTELAEYYAEQGCS